MTKTEHDLLVEYGAESVPGFGPYKVKIGNMITADSDRAYLAIRQLDAEIKASQESKSCPDCEKPNQFGELCNSCLTDRQAQPQEAE